MGWLKIRQIRLAAAYPSGNRFVQSGNKFRIGQWPILDNPLAIFPAALSTVNPVIPTVIPAYAGIPNGTEKTIRLPAALYGIPAYAGMTVEVAGMTVAICGYLEPDPE